jgi:hypothetical protein
MILRVLHALAAIVAAGGAVVAHRVGSDTADQVAGWLWSLAWIATLLAVFGPEVGAWEA